jgi:hypothetical protein
MTQLKHRFSQILLQFDTHFMSSALVDAYQTLEQRIVQRDVALFDDSAILDALEHDFAYYDSVVAVVSGNDEYRQLYAAALGHYASARHIQEGLQQQVSGFIEDGWNSAIQSSDINFQLLQHIERFYSRVLQSTALPASPSTKDITDWKHAKESEEETGEEIAMVYARYVSTHFTALQDAHVFFDAHIAPLQEQQSVLLQGKEHTRHYPHYALLDEVVALAQDEIARFEVLSAVRQSQADIIAAMEADVVYLRSRSFSVREQRQEILDCAVKVYTEPVASGHLKYDCSALYIQAKQKLDEDRESTIRLGIEILESQIRNIAHQDTITIPDRKQAAELLSVLHDVQQRTGYVYDKELDAVVDSLTDERSYSIALTPREAVHILHSSPCDVSSNPAHPGYVAACLAKLSVPEKYTPLHAALLHGANKAVVATARVLHSGQLPCPAPLTSSEKKYVDSVKQLFTLP